MSRRVNRSPAAKDRRYRRAVLRQHDLIVNRQPLGRWFYADVDGFLRRGDTLADVRTVHRTEPIR